MILSRILSILHRHCPHPENETVWPKEEEGAFDTSKGNGRPISSEPSTRARRTSAVVGSAAETWLWPVVHGTNHA